MRHVKGMSVHVGAGRSSNARNVVKKSCYSCARHGRRTSAEYDASAPQWARAREVIAGEDAVKAAATKYLPRLDSQSDEEYAAYKQRASFFGATARTLEEYLDLVFRRAPVTRAGEKIRVFLADCDRWGTEFVQYARRVVSEVLSVGRGGSLVLQDSRSGGGTSSGLRPPSSQGGEGGRAVVSCWRAKGVLDWCFERNAGRSVLTRLVWLIECAGVSFEWRGSRSRCLRSKRSRCPSFH